MTLLIGAECSDGVVIGSDQKTLRGGEVGYRNKIFEFDLGGKVLFAAEGLTGIRDDFFLLLNHEIRRRRGVDELYEVKIIVEDIIAELTRRYADRVKQDSPIGVLMAGLEGITEGKARLYYIHGVGYGEMVRFRCTGHGGQYAYSLAKFLCGPKISQSHTVRDVALLIAFVIIWVSEDVDSTVGGTPQVAMLMNEKSDVEFLSSQAIDPVRERVEEIKKDLKKFLGLDGLLGDTQK